MPEIFGWQHIVYLVVAIIVGVAAIILIKRYCKSENALTAAVKYCSLFLFVCIVANRLFIAIERTDVIQFIPATFCGFASLAFALTGMFCRKDSPVLHWISYCGFLGGLLTMIYPDFIGQAATIFYPNTITGLLHHTVAFFLSVLMYVTGYVRPTMKRWSCLPVGLAFMMTYGIFMISALGFGDAMYINEPLISGTPFTWYFTGFIFLVLHLAFLLVMEFVYKKRGEDNFYDRMAARFAKKAD